ncbi:MAG: GerMN domain-containing protein [Acidimicrobiales bacterium]
MTTRAARRRLPGWVATAVLLVTAACGIPTGGSPTVIAKANVPFHLLKPASSSTSTSAPTAVKVPEPIYLVAPNQHVIAVSRDVSNPPTLTDIVSALLVGPTATESAAGLLTFLVGSTGVSVTVVNGIATVDFASNPIQVVGPNQTLAIAQVVFTVTQQPGVIGVLFEIGGKPIEVPTASGAQVAGPVGQTSYLPQAPLP